MGSTCKYKDLNRLHDIGCRLCASHYAVPKNPPNTKSHLVQSHAYYSMILESCGRSALSHLHELAVSTTSFASNYRATQNAIGNCIKRHLGQVQSVEPVEPVEVAKLRARTSGPGQRPRGLEVRPRTHSRHTARIHLAPRFALVS